MTREITHMKAFSLALESMAKLAFSIGRIAPTPGLVDQFFNVSTGTRDHGEIVTRGPWNEGGEWVFTDSPALQSGEPGPAAAIVTESSPPADKAGLGELLLDELRDILHRKSSSPKRFRRWRKRPATINCAYCSNSTSRRRKPKWNALTNASSFSVSQPGPSRARA